MITLLGPLQPGFGVRRASGHVHHFTPGYAVAKLDFKNTFNSVYGGKKLKDVLDI